MMNRRGGLRYVLGEIKFRIYIFNLINSELYLINLFIGFLRIIVFSLPNYFKEILYRIKRN